MRVVSLIASSTEIVCALGYEEFLVGRSHECDFPESIKHLPIVTEVKFSADGTSYQIDQKIKGILQEGLSVYRVNADILKELKPDVILTQIQCEVCAVSLKDVEEATHQWLGIKPEIVSLQPNAIKDLWTDILKVAAGLHQQNRGESLVSSLKDRMNVLNSRANRLSKINHYKPKVACVEWLNPLMAAGNWVPELVEMAGGINLFGLAGQHSPWMSWEELCLKNPDILVIMPCGFDMDRTEKEMFNFTQMKEWQLLKAVKNNEVYIVDGNQYFNRPGPRLIDSLEILIEIFHPDVTAARKFENQGWKKYKFMSP